jgi:hypothetical protein
LVHFAHSHRRLVDEGGIDTANAVAPTTPHCKPNLAAWTAAA